jgi:enoyl-CoA hydratase
MSSDTEDDGQVRYQRQGPLAIITLDRPRKLNALTLSMLNQLREYSMAARDDPGVLAVVVTGEGDRAFCAGGSLDSALPAAARAGIDITSPEPQVRFFSDVFKPVVAAVRGICVGGGLEIMLGTDIRIVSDNAEFGLPEVRIGLIPGGGSHIRLPRQIPHAIAMQMLLLGETITARRAFDIGLANQITSTSDNLSVAVDVASRAARNGPLAVQTAKEIVLRASRQEDGFELEHALNRRVLTSDDVQEGLRSFTEKRPPRFTGR